MEIYNHVCIKSGCENSYQDNDPDAYYCENCQAENKKVAKQLDAKFSTHSGGEIMTPLKEYEMRKENINGMWLQRVR